MQKILVLFSFSLLLFSCSRKTTPAATSASTNNNNTTTINNAAPGTITDSAVSATTVKKTAVYNAPIKTPAPKSITVNDKAATQTADGRYYYDLEGKRYWRNKKDGKYYLYYKGMFENKNFQ